MAKRFTDTDKYKKPFYRGLPGAYKLLWDYIYCECDHAGMWIVDFEVARIYLGKDMKVSKEEALRIFNADKQRIVEIDDGSRWFMCGFIEFQYGDKFSKTNKIYPFVEKVLNKYNLHKYLTAEITEEGETKSSFRNRISQKVRDCILLENNLTCQYCQEQKDRSELVVDHIIPLEKGGTNADDNLTCSCIRCNSHKTDILPQDFISRDLSFLNPTEKLKGLINSLNAPFKKLNGVKDKDKDKDKDMDKEKGENFTFEEVWNLYQKKVGDKSKLQKKWDAISEEDKAKIFEHIPLYKTATPDRKFRKNFETYLNNKSWNDEIIADESPKSTSSNAKPQGKPTEPKNYDDEF